MNYLYDMVHWEEIFKVTRLWKCKRCHQEFEHPSTTHDCPKSNNGLGILGTWKELKETKE